MKKFLFTLAALFVAGSAFAESAFYIDDVELTQDQLGKVVVLPVKCHTEVAFNTFEINFGYEGNFTVNNTLQKLTPAFTITYFEDEFGTEVTNSFATNSMGDAVNQHKVMAFIATAGFWDENGDGEYETYGSVKWMPGDYTFYNLRITPAADFTEGTITLSGFFSSGQDTRPIETAGAALEYETVCHITLEGGSTPEDAETPVITFTPDANGVAISVAPCTSYEVIVNGTNMGQIDYVAAEYDVTKEIVVNATNAPADYNPATATDSYTLDPKPYAPAVNPTITFVPDATGVAINVENYTSYEVIVNGTNMGQITHVDAEYDVTKEIVVNAVNEPEHQEAGQATDSYTLQPKAYDPAVNPTITFEPVEGGVNIVVTDYTSYEVIVNGVNKGQIDYVAQAEENQHIVVNATNEPAHQEVGSASAEYDLVGTGGAQEQCLNPNAGYQITGYELATVTITNREPGATVYYEVFKKNDLGEWEKIDEGNFTGETYSFPVEGEGSYRIECVAKLQGKLDSDPGALEFVIHEGETTAVDELMNGKAVAGVRYFNMAGQEMQEANGMTIVVTTYTDGTTSAVKVMK